MARGGALDPDEPAIGDPSGHGRYGRLDPDPLDPDRLICHGCGRSYIALGVHIGMNPDETHAGGVRGYRLRHGLPMNTSLAAPHLAATLAAHARPAIDRLAAARSPTTLADVPQAHIVRGRRLSERRAQTRS